MTAIAGAARPGKSPHSSHRHRAVQPSNTDQHHSNRAQASNASTTTTPAARDHGSRPGAAAAFDRNPHARILIATRAATSHDDNTTLLAALSLGKRALWPAFINTSFLYL
jgi:hypothetical protein